MMGEIITTVSTIPLTGMLFMVNITSEVLKTNIEHFFLN